MAPAVTLTFSSGSSGSSSPAIAAVFLTRPSEAERASCALPRGLSHDRGGCSVPLFEGMAVIPKGKGGVGVKESTSEGTDIDVSPNELGGGEVAQVVQPTIRCTDDGANPDEETHHTVGPEGEEGIDGW